MKLSFVGRPYVGPLVIAALFLALGLPNIGAPMLNAEEALECQLALELLTTPVERLPQPFWRDLLPGVELFGRHFPLMEDTPYTGAPELYWQLPVSAVLGWNALSIRLVPLLFALLGLLCAHAVFRRWFGPRVALVAALVTVTHPIFLLFTREGHDKEEVFTLAMFWLGVWLIQQFFEGKGRAFGLTFALGLFCFGVGLWHKITFIWYLAGLGVAFPLWRWKVVEGQPPAAGHWLAGALGFVAGALPLIVFNATQGGVTARIMWESLIRPTPKDFVNNLDIGTNLWIRIQHMAVVMVNGDLWDPNWFRVLEGWRNTPNYLNLIIFAPGLLLVPLWAWARRHELYGRRVLWLWVVYGVAFFTTAFTVSSFNPSHMLVMYPLPGLVTALLGRTWGPPRGRCSRWP